MVFFLTFLLSTKDCNESRFTGWYSTLLKFLKPNIIIHLSDEWGTKNDYQILSKYTKLLFEYVIKIVKT